MTASGKRVKSVHKLKSWPQFFAAILDQTKTYELRKRDDRNFSIGDILVLQEFDPQGQRYTGREAQLEITYITSSEYPCALSEKALHEDFCILGVHLLTSKPAASDS